MNITNARYINESHTLIDAEIQHLEFGLISSTLSAGDPETADLFAQAVAEGVVDYVQPVVTQEEAVAEINQAVEVYLSILVSSNGFVERKGYGAYAGYPNGFRSLAEAIGAHEALVWLYCKTELDKVTAGTRGMPTPAEFLSELPGFIAP